MLGSFSTGLGLLWISISLFRVARAYPPPPPFTYGRVVAAILPCAVTMICGGVRILIDQDNQWLTAIVVIALLISTVCSWSVGAAIHRRVGILVQTNKDLDRLRKVVDKTTTKERRAYAEELLEEPISSTSNSAESAP